MEKSLKEVLHEGEFDNKNEIKGFPIGETQIVISKCKVQSIPVTFDGKSRNKFVIEYDGNKYWAGNQIMKGLKAAENNGVDVVKVVRQGEELDTTYMVLEVNE